MKTQNVLLKISAGKRHVLACQAPRVKSGVYILMWAQRQTYGAPGATEHASVAACYPHVPTMGWTSISKSFGDHPCVRGAMGVVNSYYLSRADDGRWLSGFLRTSEDENHGMLLPRITQVGAAICYSGFRRDMHSEACIETYESGELW